MSGATSLGLCRCQTISPSPSKKLTPPTSVPAYATTCTTTHRTTQINTNSTSPSGRISVHLASPAMSAPTPSTRFSGPSYPSRQKTGLISHSYHAQLVFVLIKLPSDVRATRSSSSIHFNQPQTRSASNFLMLMSLPHPHPSPSRFAASPLKGPPLCSTWPPFTLSWPPPRTGPVKTV